MKNTNLEQALEYFKQPAFQRIFGGLKERYISLGRIGGTVTLSNLEEREIDVLEGFFQVDCHNREKLVISADRMEKALLQTRFSNISLEELLNGYFPNGMVSKKDKVKKERQQEQEYFSKIAEGAMDTRAGEWFCDMIENQNGAFLLLKQDIKNNSDWVLENIPYVLKALNELPCWEQKRLRLPVFAASITGNPHYFDEGSRMFRYLLYGICEVCEIPYPKQQTAEVKAEILYQAGILKDDISSFVTCIGITGFCLSGEMHKGLQGFYELKEMVQLNLYHLGQLNSVRAVTNQVYVVENPAIFQGLVEETKGNISIVCANGQLRIAVLILLDLLIKSGCELWYSGDFDPEGLTIAQKLKNRYGKKLCLWHYEWEDYEMAKSTEKITEERLKKLCILSDTILQKVSGWILQEGVAGYQENMWERLKKEFESREQ